MTVRLPFSGGSASQEWGVSLAGIGGQLAQEYTSSAFQCIEHFLHDCSADEDEQDNLVDEQGCHSQQNG